MLSNLKTIIEQDYSLNVAAIVPAPRQLVAKTYFIDIAETDQRYFLKVVDKPLWIAKIIRSLPALLALKDCGIEQISYPILTPSGAAYILRGEVLLVVFNYIEGSQSYDYDTFEFGKLLGKIHAATPKITVPVPQEAFHLDVNGVFLEQYHHFLLGEHSDVIGQKTQRVLQKHQADIEQNLTLFKKLQAQYHPAQETMVITHGDAGGNVMMTSPDKIAIIDWDEILLAPPERDVWFFENIEPFMQGYRVHNPGFQINAANRDFCILNQYFWYMFYYFEIFLANKDEKETLDMIEGFDGYFEDWIKPYIDALIRRHQ